MNGRHVALFILEQILGVAVMGAALFVSAGTLNWWPAWAAICVWFVWYAATDTILMRQAPGLLVERLAPPRGARSWDRAILGGARLLQLVRYIVAGLDLRYGWTSDFSVVFQIVALIVCGLSYALLAWAMASNAYFSQVVRIQHDRGHIVVTGGPYRFVRHPGYLGAAVFEPAMSLLLGSWWATVPGALCAILFVIRTALEDRLLRTELQGYADYARLVPFRLVPGLW